MKKIGNFFENLAVACFVGMLLFGGIGSCSNGHFEYSQLSSNDQNIFAGLLIGMILFGVIGWAAKEADK